MDCSKLLVFLALAVLTAHVQANGCQGYTPVPKTKNEFKQSGVLPGCPSNFSYVSNVSKVRMQGGWYAQYLSSDGKELGCDGCWTLYLTEQYDRSLLVVFCCQKDGQPYCSSALGGGTSTDSECNPGQFLYIFQGVAVISYVLDIDYDNYLVGYFCTRLPNGEDRQAIFVLTRTPTVCKCSFEPWLFKLLEKNGIDNSIAVPIKHGRHCKYTYGCQYCGCAGTPY